MPIEVIQEMDRASEQSRRELSEKFGFDVGAHHFDKEGEPIGLGTWGALRQEEEYWRIGFDRIWPIEVSTVWFGLDMGTARFIDPDAPPIIYETASFRWHGRFEREHIEVEDRYATEEEARAGHAAVVGRWRQAIKEVAGMTVEEIPNPGSDEAREQGCKCPVLDNNHGEGYMGQEGIFVMVEGCPLHGEEFQELVAQRARELDLPED